MFRGSSFHTIDPKGRIIIPSRFRDILKEGGGDGVVVSQMDQCVVAYTFDEWSKIESRILATATKSEKMRRFRRVFIGGACECHCDKQGRILIPPNLRQYANLEKEIVLVGVLDHFEISSRERWENEHLTLEEDMVNEEEFRNEIANLGL
ncbi:MAG: division/cell wall cluster transcriptional repressor MraZ [Proteobacteria bacterium]|nr:division/cell wall cluster transcriptional repressor MraZ [Pseudomonadota bacterium]